MPLKNTKRHPCLCTHLLWPCHLLKPSHHLLQTQRATTVQTMSRPRPHCRSMHPNVPFVNRPFESEIHGSVNFTQFCCVLLVTWCYRVLLLCYLRPK